MWDTVCGSWVPIINTIIVIITCMVCYSEWIENERHLISVIISSVKTMITLSPIVVVIAITVGERCIVPNAKIAFKQGFTFDNNITCLVQRPNALSELKSILKPQYHSGGYFLLEGPHGCGKTTILKQAVSESGSGVLYVPLASNGDVGASLYSALKIDMFCEGWGIVLSYLHLPFGSCQVDSSKRLKLSLKILIEAATEIAFEEGYPPSVAIDNTAQILKLPDGLKVLHLLQDTAKDAADRRNIIILFVSSERNVPSIIKSRSSVSRLHPSIILGDITDQEAIHYLSCMCPNASNNTITNTVRLTGGRFSDLVKATLLVCQENADQLQEELFHVISENIRRLKKETKSFQITDVTFDIAKCILKSPDNTISMETYESLMGVLNVEHQESVEASNFFFISAEGVTFHSRVTEHYFKAYLTSNSTAGQFK